MLQRLRAQGSLARWISVFGFAFHVLAAASYPLVSEEMNVYRGAPPSVCPVGSQGDDEASLRRDQEEEGGAGGGIYRGEDRPSPG